jgi:DoxX-like family
MKPKTINILYWIFTVLFALAMLSTCIPNEEGYKFITELLGYPGYFVNYIAVMKVLGVIALLIPGFPRVKEWAYAGLFLDMVSAVYSFYATNMVTADTSIMLIFFGLGIASYVFYHKKLRATGL